MGRNNKIYHRDLKQQVYDKLNKMLQEGEGSSKKEAIADGTERGKIFSYSTYHTYRKYCNYFVNYIRQNHPKCTTLKAAKKYVNEWLQYRVEQVDKKGNHLSAWTIQTEAKALGRLYGIQPDDKNYFQAPRRRREDIKRSRVPTARDRHFSEKNNDEFIRFCRGTGCRRNVMEKLEGRDLITKAEMYQVLDWLKSKVGPSPRERAQINALEDAIKNFPNQDYFLHHRGDKGGRQRYAPIIGEDKEIIITRMRATAPNEKVWQHVPGNADIHSYRGDYATAIYRMYARKIVAIPFDRIIKELKDDSSLECTRVGKTKRVKNSIKKQC